MSNTFAKDTSKRTIKEWCLGIFVLVIGLIIAHLGVTLFLLSQLGSDPFTVFVQGVSMKVGLSIGTCHVILLCIITLFLFFTTKNYVKPGTIVCAFLGGWIIDFFLWIFADTITIDTALWIRYAVLIAGCVILSFGMSIVIKSNSGTGPNDLVAIVVADKIHTWKNVNFRWVRMACDVVFVGVGFAFGGVIGAGTLVAVILIGPVVQFFLPRSEKIIARFFPTL